MYVRESGSLGAIYRDQNFWKDFRRTHKWVPINFLSLQVVWWSASLLESMYVAQLLAAAPTGSGDWST